MTAAKTTILCATVVLLALIGCVTFLTWQGHIDGQAAIAFFTGLSFAGLAGGATHVATTTGARAALKKTEGS